MNKETMRKAIDTYGATAQMDMLVEECAELIQAVNKYKRKCEGYKMLVEEIADVEIMLEQTKMILERDGYSNIGEEIEKGINFKLDRLEKRLNAKE